ncbi:glycosyl transferase [Allorhizobium undicola]|uniref:O-linked N-acetylglucosamine transferase, SPINDLY family protein n=1 Tax=Allorhizobium undicola TaxID=78527 RepID=UPI003D350B98
MAKLGELLMDAQTLYRDGCFQAAADILEAERAQAPLSLPNTLILAQCRAKLGQPADAARHFGEAADLPGAERKLLLRLAMTMMRQAGRNADAFPYAAALIEMDPLDEKAMALYRHMLHRRLDIDEKRKSNATLRAALASGSEFAAQVENPLENLYWCGDETLNAAVRRFQGGASFTEESRQSRRSRPHRFHHPLRIGYLSADFSDIHATMILLQGVIDCHDPLRVDVRLFCITPEALRKADHDFRKRHEDKIVDLAGLSDEEAHRRIRAEEIDILVDLKGHTMDARPNIVNSGPAPIQVAYLGFPGSSHGIDCDYILTDAIVTPETSKPFYHEKFCLLPESYQCNDMLRRPLPIPLTRAQLGLPEDRFVFHSANAVQKISPETFDVWMRILMANPDSVLHLFCPDEDAGRQFLAAAEASGVAGNRVVFRRRSSYQDHLASMPAADLALDCFPWNGHTTTSELLWMGVPVLTRRGTNFASRVSESLLRAIGLPELVAGNENDFVNLACELVRNPEKLKEYRRRLQENRRMQPLFDTQRFARHLEKAYRMMVERAQAGLPPDHFAVPPEPPRTLPFTLGRID